MAGEIVRALVCLMASVAMEHLAEIRLAGVPVAGRVQIAAGLEREGLVELEVVVPEEAADRGATGQPVAGLQLRLERAAVGEAAHHVPGGLAVQVMSSWSGLAFRDLTCWLVAAEAVLVKSFFVIHTR